MSSSSELSRSPFRLPRLHPGIYQEVACDGPDGGQVKRLGADLLATAAHDRALDHNGELADVAWPVVAPQLLFGVARQPPGLTLALGQPSRELSRER